jgi:hypothetical protein
MHFCFLLCTPHAPRDKLTDPYIMHSAWIVQYCRLLWNTQLSLSQFVFCLRHARSDACMCVIINPFAHCGNSKVGDSDIGANMSVETLYVTSKVRTIITGVALYNNVSCLRSSSCCFLQFLSPTPCTTFFTNLNPYSFLKTRDKVSTPNKKTGKTVPGCW